MTNTFDNKILTYNQKSVRVVGTNENPWFCGRDICDILEYSDYRKALFKFVDDENKKSLKDLSVAESATHKITYNEGQMCYINEKGLYNFLNSSRSSNKVQLKAFIDQFLYDLRYKSGIMDIFSFMKGKDIEIDVQSEWFQDLWYPLSKKQHILGSMLLLTWLGYEGEYYTQRQRFQKLLSNNSIPYEEVDYSDERFREHEVMIKEIAATAPNNLEKKRWIVMTVRNFKKAVLRLNTKNAETIRDYYLNLEEICFEYAECQAQWLRDKADKERQIAQQRQQMADDELNRKIAQLAIKDKSEEELQAKLEEEKRRAELAEQAKDEERQRAELAEQAKEEAERAKEEERHRADEEKVSREHAEARLRSETAKLKEQLRKTLDFNQATKKVEPTEYIYVVTTAQYQQ